MKKIFLILFISLVYIYAYDPAVAYSLYNYYSGMGGTKCGITLYLVAGGTQEDHTSCNTPCSTCRPGEPLHTKICVDQSSYIYDTTSNTCVVSCPPGTDYNSTDNTCQPLSPCPSGQHRNSSNECVSDCNFTAPVVLGDYPLLGDFNTSEEALNYFQTNNIQNGYIQSATSLGASENCTGFYAYGQLPKDDPCNNVQYELVVNGYPLQGLFTSYDTCVNYINNNHFGNGVCKSYGDCSKVFAYYQSDNNVSFFPDINNSTPPTLDNLSFDYNDNNYSAPANIDDNNDSVDMSPVLNQLSDLSKKQHDDMKNLANKADVTNNNLNTISNKIDTTNNKLDSIDKKLSDLNGDNFLGDLSFTQMTDFYNNLQTDLSSIDTQYNDFKNAISGGFDGYTISSGAAPVFTATVFGKTLTLDLCSTFSVFRPFVSFIFSALFLFLAIRIFWLGVKL